MSGIGYFWALRNEDLAAIVKNPALIRQLQGESPLPAQSSSLFTRLFGYKEPPTAATPIWTPSKKPVEFDVDKAWHGIHFLLTGSAWKGSGPLAFILVGGTELKEGAGHGPARCYGIAEVRQIDDALKSIDPSSLYEQADPKQFSRMNIYPDIWDSEPKEDCVGYVASYLADLKKFISETAQANRALVVYLG